MPEPEVTVVGLGIMGSCTLWQLAARRVRAVGCERFTPPHNRGASHGHSRMLRRLQFEGDQYVALADRAYELWRQLQRETGRPLFTRTGLLIIGPGDSQLIRGARESAERCGQRERNQKQADQSGGHWASQTQGANLAAAAAAGQANGPLAACSSNLKLRSGVPAACRSA